MSDYNQPGDGVPELEARPPRPSSPSSPGLPSSRNSNVVSAARLKPVTAERPATKERLKEGAVDTVLNSVGLLSDTLDDFKNRDRYFKYKAMVLGAWFLLTCTSFGVACYGGPGPTNKIGAELIVTNDVTGDRKVFMLKNGGSDTWQAVEITVNGKWKATRNTVGPNDDIGLNILYDPDGKRAPSTLGITDIEIKVADPEAEFHIYKGGQVQQ